ncbi:MAG: ADP-ribosylglycohydrolase family protein, partial [Parafilimonas terrae]|nr:ADP-ribosylglycohydrolase family protein [Parafilimonas terrae]
MTASDRPSPVLPADYHERVYAGVLGKLIGVYLGRPFEGWTYRRVARDLGEVEHYVHERFGVPLVVPDDDVSGTFTFVRALARHDMQQELTAQEVGRTWLDTIIEGRTILWWGGNGTSTEHTAWLNLKRGIPAPESGSAARNGRTLAEQIGAQIFIDGWAMVAPGRPGLAARLAEAAARVSHDGEAVQAARLLAAMEAEAFVSADIDHLLDTGLAEVPGDSIVARLAGDVRAWHARHADWRDTRALIERHYGYDRHPGICHVVPNHALILMALLYGEGDFHRSMTIVATSGWDTDCNAGNLGCLLGLMGGLPGFEGGPDWRGPIADRLLISSADGGYSINDAARVALDLVDLGNRLAGWAPPARPKGGARFHFALPGSVQGFRAAAPHVLSVEQAGAGEGGALVLRLAPGGGTAYVGTPTFIPPEIATFRSSYDLQATPLLYPGQALRAEMGADAGNTRPVTVRLQLRTYGADDLLVDVEGPAETLSPGDDAALRWIVPDLDGQPVAEIGLALSGAADLPTVVRLGSLTWDGAPDLRLRRPGGGGTMWRRAWVNAVTTLGSNLPEAFRISQDRGEGLLIHGTRDWTDYKVASTVTIHLGTGGIAARVRGLRRFLALLLGEGDRLRLVRQHDGMRMILADVPCPWRRDEPRHLSLAVDRRRLVGCVDGE